MKSKILVDTKYREGLFKIEESKDLDIVYFFHKSNEYALKTKTPHWGARGVFASRSHNRPAPIGISRVKLLQVKGNCLIVEGLDALNGIPVLDIKPHCVD
jgi:tRNA-Thr(GGU) m(6)t(6)A37 methyltransferase TsaA